MENFESLVEAVLENNRMNSSKWSDWDSALHIQEVYGYLEENRERAVYEAFLDMLIRDNGENLETYQEAVDCMKYGYAFARGN
jgi:hypothetical protein